MRDEVSRQQDDENTRAPALACVVVDCVQDCARGHNCWWLDCGVVLLNIRTPPRTMLFASTFDLSEDSTFVIHDFVFAKSSNSFIFSLHEILSTPRPQRLTRIACLRFRESANSFASAVDNSLLGC